MNNCKSVAICISNFNMANSISKAIDSALNQSYENLDVIIVDNASTDSSWNIISGYSQKYNNVKIYRNEKHLPIDFTGNKLLEYTSDYGYVNFLSADDTLEHDFVKECLRLYGKSNTLLGYVSTSRNDVIGDDVFPQKAFYKHSAIIKGLEQFVINLKGYSISPGQILFNNFALKKVNGFDVRFRAFADMHMVLRLNSLFDVGYINKPLFNYTKSGTSETSMRVRKKLAPNFIYSIKMDIIENHLLKEFESRTEELKKYVNQFMVKYCTQFIPTMMRDKEYKLALEYLLAAASYDASFYRSKLFDYLEKNIESQNNIDMVIFDCFKKEFLNDAVCGTSPPYDLPNGSIAI